MIIPRHVLRTTPLPPPLLTAAVDFVADEQPDLAASRTPLADLALAIGYDHLTSAVLVVRVSATARLFAHPGWAAFAGYRKMMPLEHMARFQIIVLHYLATEPLDGNLDFDPRRLLAVLLDRLPCQGSA